MLAQHTINKLGSLDESLKEIHCMINRLYNYFALDDPYFPDFDLVEGSEENIQAALEVSKSVEATLKNFCCNL